jgi:hypothetical protein
MNQQTIQIPTPEAVRQIIKAKVRENGLLKNNLKIIR